VALGEEECDAPALIHQENKTRMLNPAKSKNVKLNDCLNVKRNELGKFNGDSHI